MTYDEYVNIVYSHNFFKFKEGALVFKEMVEGVYYKKIGRR